MSLDAKVHNFVQSIQRDSWILLLVALSGAFSTISRNFVDSLRSVLSDVALFYFDVCLFLCFSTCCLFFSDLPFPLRGIGCHGQHVVL